MLTELNLAEFRYVAGGGNGKSMKNKIKPYAVAGLIGIYNFHKGRQQGLAMRQSVEEGIDAGLFYGILLPEFERFFEDE